MAFVNEYVSVADFDKYGVHEVWAKFQLKGRVLDINTQKFAWTVDRERNAFLIPVRRGREELSGRVTFSLCWNGDVFSAELDLEESSFDYERRTGHSVWGLVNFSRPESCAVSNDEFIRVLKEALIVYQCSGIITPMAKYPVAFSF